MSNPQLKVEVAFASNLSDPYPLWSDVSAYVSGGKVKRGRTYELNRIETGEASFVLDNADGRFTPGADWSVILDEHFGDLAGTATGTGTIANFTAGSGGWEAENTRGGVTAGPLTGGGLRVSGVSDTTSNLKAARLVPLAAGVAFRVKAKVRVTAGGTGAASTRLRVYFKDAAGTTLGAFVDSPLLVSSGGWVTLDYTFTAPTAAAQPTFTQVRASVAGFPTAAADNGLTASLDVTSFQVSLVAPYAGQIKPRRPVRVYTVHDDNWLHYETVSPDKADLDWPRFHNWGTSSPDITLYTSGALNRDTWRFTRDGNSQFAWFSGMDDPCDWLRVETGQQITFRAKISNSASYSVGPSVGLVLDFKATGPDAFSGVAWSPTYTDTAWHDASVTWTATAAGYVRAGIIGTATDNKIRVYAVDLKVTYGATASAVSPVISGRYPSFTGYVERFTQEYSGLLPTVAVSCVDGRAILSRPIRSKYRQAVLDWCEANNTGGYANAVGQYWPVVESAESAYAYPLLGADPLRVTQTATAPGSYGFTTDKTMTFADGESSGGFTVKDSGTVTSAGAMLQLAREYRPALPAGRTSLTVDLWWTPDTFATGQYLFNASNAAGNVMSIIANTNGSILFTYTDPSGSCSATTAAGVAKTGVPIHIGIEAEVQLGSSFLTGYVNGVIAVQASTPVGAGVPALPGVGTAVFGALHTADASGKRIFTNGFRGTLNHLFIGWGIVTQLFHGAVHAAGLDTTELESERLGRLLDAAGWVGPRRIDAGLSVLLPSRYNDGADAADALSDAAEAAGGDFLIGQAGEAAYLNRQRRMGAPVRWTLREWSDGIRFEVDDSLVFNTVRAQRATGLHREVSDADSIREYGVKNLPVSRDVNDPDEVGQAAAWLLHRYRESRPRCDTLRVQAHTVNGGSEDASTLGMAYGANPGDRLALIDLPATAPADALDYFVEGVEVAFAIDGGVLTWDATYSVSDAALSEAWILEDPVSGLLDSDACVVIY